MITCRFSEITKGEKFIYNDEVYIKLENHVDGGCYGSGFPIHRAVNIETAQEMRKIPRFTDLNKDDEECNPIVKKFDQDSLKTLREFFNDFVDACGE